MTEATPGPRPAAERRAGGGRRATGTPVLQTGLKMLTVIDALARAEAGLSVSGLAERLGWARAAAHQYLQTAVAAGWAFQDDRSVYRVSLRVADLATRANPAKELRPMLLPVMHDTVEELGAPVSFAVMEQSSPVIVERVEPARAKFIRRGYEARVSPRSSASGQVLLAFSDEVHRAVAREGAVLDDAVYENVRQRGFALVHSEWLGDLITAVAVPVTKGGTCIGALSVITEQGGLPDDTLITAMLRASRRLDDALDDPTA
ncbi:helix-turn-helix domain-containing protein [Leucobacter sp. USCH14]|uniref:IclR family transcriptional regulator n=1 Tax=Leucobacter sp. USCH14 TaxID=3024838 RepID=UPI0030980DB2